RPALAPTLDVLAGVSEQQLSDVAAALCEAPNNACTRSIVPALHCLTGRCRIAIPPPPHPPPPPPPPSTCDPVVKETRSPRHGLGLQWGTGWQDDAHPVDHRAWSLGFEGRTRLHEDL